MLRRLFLWLSERRSIFQFVKRNGLARRLAERPANVGFLVFSVLKEAATRP